jgi:4-amino-4-deoxy-L-arabinose transferase-like glycosyltransferase
MFALPGALAADGFRRGWSGLLRRSIVPILAYVLILSPWIIRNYAVTRRFIPGVDGFGYQYLLGSSAMKFGVPLPKSIEPLLPKGHEQVLFATLDKEANQKLDEIAKREMIDTILHRPAQFVRRVAHQFRWFWIGDKRNRQLSGTLEHLAYMLPLLLGAIAAMLLQWRTSGCLILIAVPTMIIHSVVVALVNESMYSAPVLPILAVMSACAAGDLVNRWRQSKHRHAPVMAEAAAA